MAEKKIMEMEKKEFNWGRLTCSIPMSAKLKIMYWQHRSGLRKAEFLRGAMLIGALKIADETGARHVDESYCEFEQDRK